MYFIGRLELQTPLDVSFDGTSDCANSSCEIDFCGTMISGKVRILETDCSSGKKLFVVVVDMCYVDVCSCAVLADGWIITASGVLTIHMNYSTPVFFRART